jgi:hypothetical protein
VKKLDVPQSGSQADTTASRNRFGQYNRTRAMPTQPYTVRQVLVRGRLTDASQAWRELTDEVRATWNAYAAVTPRVDSLGQTIYLTGHQQFVSLYGVLSNAGLAVPPDVPSEAPPAPPTVAIVAIADDGTLTLSVAETLAADLVLVVSASPQRSAGVSFERDTRFVVKFTAKTMGNVEVGAAYVAKYGSMILGRKIFLDAVLVTAEGGPSAPVRLVGVVDEA